MPSFRLLAWIGLLLCLAGSLSAEPLTVSAALTQAYAKNPELAAAQAETRQTQAAYEQAGSLNSGAFTAGMSRGQGQAALSSISALPRDEYLQYEQPFQPFGVLKKGEYVAWLNWQEANARLNFARIGLMRRTKDAFYQQLLVQEQIKVLESNRQLAQQIFVATEKRFSQKRGSLMDVLAARVQRNQVDQALVQAEGELQAAQAELAPLMGLAAGTRLEVSGVLDTQYEGLRLDEVLALGEKSPALEAARQATLSRHEQVKLAELQGNPAPSLVALYDFRIPSYIVGAQLSIPLDWGQIGYDVQAKSEAASAQDARMRAVVLEVFSEIHKAYAAFLAGVKNSASYQKDVLTPQEEAVRLIRAEFDQRKVDYDQVLLGQQQLAGIRLEYLRQQLQERLALNALEEAVGSPVEVISPQP